MDSEFTSLARSAGGTVVTLVASDAWQAAREGIVRLWRRFQPDRAETVAAELDVSRDDILAVLDAAAADDERTTDEIRAEWQGRFRRLLVAHPEAAGELRRLLAELAPRDAATVVTVDQRATASDSARVYQAGRDQHITER